MKITLNQLELFDLADYESSSYYRKQKKRGPFIKDQIANVIEEKGMFELNSESDNPFGYPKIPYCIAEEILRKESRSQHDINEAIYRFGFVDKVSRNFNSACKVLEERGNPAIALRGNKQDGKYTRNTMILITKQALETHPELKDDYYKQVEWSYATKLITSKRNIEKKLSDEYLDLFTIDTRKIVSKELPKSQEFGNLTPFLLSYNKRK